MKNVKFCYFVNSWVWFSFSELKGDKTLLRKLNGPESWNEFHQIFGIHFNDSVWVLGCKLYSVRCMVKMPHLFCVKKLAKVLDLED